MPRFRDSVQDGAAEWTTPEFAAWDLVALDSASLRAALTPDERDVARRLAQRLHPAAALLPLLDNSRPEDAAESDAHHND